MRMLPAALTLRRTALVSLAALGVHQLRYLLGYGHDSGNALAQHGHGYLDAALPVLIPATVLAAAATLAIGALSPARTTTRPRSTIARASAYALLVLALITAQELVEGVLFPGHPSGLDAVLSHGGWLVLPFAVLFGALVSLALSGLDAVERRFATDPSQRAVRAAVTVGSGCRTDLRPLAARPLAFGLARRPPPVPKSAV